MKSTRSAVFRVVSLIAALLLAVGCAETLGRWVWKIKYTEWLSGQLHGYEILDRERGLILPKARTVITVGENRRNLIANRKPIGLAEIDKLVSELSLTDDDIMITINSLGFRGPEITCPKPDSVLRVLTIGDSCTWGPGIDAFTYPRFVQEYLSDTVRERCDKELEVVNGGVPGYNFERVLKRIEEYLAVEPDLATIYLGWNRTIGRADPRKNEWLYRRFATYRFYYHAVVNRTDTGISEDYSTSTFFDPSDPSLHDFEHYDFGPDIADLETLVDCLRERGTTVVIVTLAGLLDTRIAPDELSLEVAYPISSTKNLAAYPLLTNRYNEALREFAHSKRIPIVDFEQHAYEHLNPRIEFFSDSVHLTLKGYEEMGRFLAEDLRGLLTCE